MPRLPGPAGPARHARLFEYLRQHNVAEDTSRRLHDEERARIDGMDAAIHLALANRSWQRPKVAPAERRSAAKAGRDHEFFRAVGA